MSMPKRVKEFLANSRVRNSTPFPESAAEAQLDVALGEYKAVVVRFNRTGENSGSIEIVGSRDFLAPSAESLASRMRRPT